jgi:transcriptional regulator with XRE-family HTH domain
MTGVLPPRVLDPRKWTEADLPEVLRALRDLRRLTQANVAHACGCTASSVRSWKAGRSTPGPRRRPPLESVLGLAVAISVSLSRG